MPTLVAFWNINMGASSYDERITTFVEWCSSIKPDLLLLEEVSDTLAGEMPGLTGMDTINYVNTLDKNGNESTKQLWALQKTGLNFTGTPLQFPGLYAAKRMLVKVTSNKFALWVIHANASTKGGKAAVAAVNNYLDNTPYAVVGGDFNCPIANAGVRACHPLSWQNNPLLLTQWNKVEGMTTTSTPGLHLAWPNGNVFYKKIVPHNVIDYIMPGANRTATAVPNCPDEAMWRNILLFFDHCPVVYNLNFP